MFAGIARACRIGGKLLKAKHLPMVIAPSAYVSGDRSTTYTVYLCWDQEGEKSRWRGTICVVR